MFLTNIQSFTVLFACHGKNSTALSKIETKLHKNSKLEISLPLMKEPKNTSARHQKSTQRMMKLKLSKKKVAAGKKLLGPILTSN